MGLKVPPAGLIVWRVLVIKSDQNGIESNLRLELLNHFVPDKIRPKWDWKSKQETLTFTTKTDKIRPKWDWKRITLETKDGDPVKIKSDQNGIERRKWSKSSKAMAVDKIRPKWDWKSSFPRPFPQRAGIKSDQNGIESEFVVYFRLSNVWR